MTSRGLRRSFPRTDASSKLAPQLLLAPTRSRRIPRLAALAASSVLCASLFLWLVAAAVSGSVGSASARSASGFASAPDAHIAGRKWGVPPNTARATPVSRSSLFIGSVRGGAAADDADDNDTSDAAPIMSADEPAEKKQKEGGDGEQPPQGLNGMDLIVDGWFHERGELWPGQAMSLQVKKVLDHHRSKFQDVLVFESTHHGTVLVLDGVIQVTERDEFAYQEMIAHIPLYAHPDPKRVLVIGGGDGGVLREIARHPGVEEIVICEIDGDVIDVSKKYLPGLAKGYDDPRVKVHIMDGAKFMSENKDSFDVIITDSSDPIGPASVLFETPFYNAMHASLREGGVVCTQGECMWLHVDLIRPLVKSIARTYTDVGYAYTTIPTYPSGQIGFIIGTKGRGPCAKPARTPSEEVQKELRYYSPELHEAAFVLPAFAKRAIFED